MLRERIEQYHQASRLEHTIAAMPEYPIYQVPPGRYIIYIAGQGYLFNTEAGARLGQLSARAEWLRAQSREEPK